jgi:hypothetical protein
MNPLRISIIAAIICVASSAFADPIKIGSGIDNAIEVMKAKNYDDSSLAMGPTDESNDLKFWVIDDGVLIAVYSKKDKRIKSMSYWFADERGKRDRKEFSLSVLEFDPDTGVMTLQTKKKEGEQ